MTSRTSRTARATAKQQAEVANSFGHPVVTDIYSVMPSCKEAQTILGLKAVSRFKRLVGRRKKQNKKKKNLNKSLGLYLCHTACLLLKHNLQMCASLANHTKASVPGNQSCSCQHFLTQCPRTRADLTDTAALKEREGTICVPEATPPRQKHHSSQGKPC